MKLIVAVVLLLSLSSANAEDIAQAEALQLQQQGKILSLDNILALIETRHPQFSLLEVELEEDDGLYIYEVELSTRDGVIRELEINARTGSILQDEEDD